MYPNLPVQKKEKHSLLSRKSSLVFIAMITMVQLLEAQKIPPPPLSRASKNYKPVVAQSSTQPSNFTPTLSPTAGTWTALSNLAPHYNTGVMILLSDGTVLAKTATGSSYGTIYDKLTPDASGSYLHGT